MDKDESSKPTGSWVIVDGRGNIDFLGFICEIKKNLRFCFKERLLLGF
jgi:hypothetical protein